MELEKLFSAKEKIIIVGVLPIESEIVNSAKKIVGLFQNNFDFKLSIYHESENDLFARSLY